MGSIFAAHSLSSCGARAPECTGSVVVARGLSCPVACGILAPRPGVEPASPALEGGFLTTGLPGKSLTSSFLVVRTGMIASKLFMCLSWQWKSYYDYFHGRNKCTLYYLHTCLIISLE